MVTDEEQRQIASALAYADIELPSDAAAQIRQYLTTGTKPRPFLLAAIQGVFTKTHLLSPYDGFPFRALALLLVNHLPRNAWGSPQKVNAWMRRFDVLADWSGPSMTPVEEFEAICPDLDKQLNDKAEEVRSELLKKVAEGGF